MSCALRVRGARAGVVPRAAPHPDPLPAANERAGDIEDINRRHRGRLEQYEGWGGGVRLVNGQALWEAVSEVLQDGLRRWRGLWEMWETPRFTRRFPRTVGRRALLSAAFHRPSASIARSTLLMVHADGYGLSALGVGTGGGVGSSL